MHEDGDAHAHGHVDAWVFALCSIQIDASVLSKASCERGRRAGVSAHDEHEQRIDQRAPARGKDGLVDVRVRVRVAVLVHVLVPVYVLVYVLVIRARPRPR